MKVLHVIPSISSAHGGPSRAVRDLCRAVRPWAIECEVATTDDDGPGRRLKEVLGRRVIERGITLRYFQKQTEFYKVSLPLDRWLARNVRNYDLVHIHALFSFTSVSAAFRARRARIPYVVNPHGALNTYGQLQRRTLKSFSLALIEGPLLKSAAAMQYSSIAEQLQSAHVVSGLRSEVIPLGLEIAALRSDSPSPAGGVARWPAAAGKKVVLFLSRVNPVKGIEILLEAFAKVRQTQPHSILLLAGNGERGYMRQLQRFADSLALGASVIWAGHVEGKDKAAAFSLASVFVLPSRSESFGMAVIEALAAGVPVIVSEGVAIAPEVVACNAGVAVKREATELAQSISRFLANDSYQECMAQNARKLAINRFSLDETGRRLARFYHEILDTDGTDRVAY